MNNKPVNYQELKEKVRQVSAIEGDSIIRRLSGQHLVEVLESVCYDDDLDSVNYFISEVAHNECFLRAHKGEGQ